VQVHDDPDAEAMLRQQVAQVVESTQSQHTKLLEDRLVNALKDFAYRELSFDLIPRDDGLTLQVHVAGKGRKVPQEIDLTARFHGFDQLVDLALDFQSGLTRAKDRVEGTGARTSLPTDQGPR
jgi:hypothetical protein